MPPGGPPATEPPQGECVVTALDTGTGLAFSDRDGCMSITGPLRIDRADPRILVAGPLVRLWLGGRSPDLPAVLVIDGVNRKAVYRISRYHPGLDAYEAEWPD